jgi:hypothetical protein
VSLHSNFRNSPVRVTRLPGHTLRGTPLSLELAAVYLRRARNWTFVSAILGTVTFGLELWARASLTVVTVVAIAAVFAWRSVVVQTRSVRSLSSLGPANER